MSWGSGGGRRTGRRTGGPAEHGGPGSGLFSGLNSIPGISITKASSAAGRRDPGAWLGKHWRKWIRWSDPQPPPPRELPSLPRPNFPLIHVRGLRVSLSIATLDHRSWSLYHADLMSVEANPEGCDYHEGSAQPAAQPTNKQALPVTPDREEQLQKVTARNLQLLLS